MFVLNIFLLGKASKLKKKYYSKSYLVFYWLAKLKNIAINIKKQHDVHISTIFNEQEEQLF